MVNIKAVAGGLVIAIISIIIIMQIVGNTANDVVAGAGNVSSSGLPLASLFSSNGVVMLAYVAGILIAIVGLAFAVGKMRN